MSHVFDKFIFVLSMTLHIMYIPCIMKNILRGDLTYLDINWPRRSTKIKTEDKTNRNERWCLLHSVINFSDTPKYVSANKMLLKGHFNIFLLNSAFRLQHLKLFYVLMTDINFLSVNFHMNVYIYVIKTQSKNQFFRQSIIHYENVT